MLLLCPLRKCLTRARRVEINGPPYALTGTSRQRMLPTLSNWTCVENMPGPFLYPLILILLQLTLAKLQNNKHETLSIALIPQPLQFRTRMRSSSQPITVPRIAIGHMDTRTNVRCSCFHMKNSVDTLCTHLSCPLYLPRGLPSPFIVLTYLSHSQSVCSTSRISHLSGVTSFG